jgi:hypothetical protein
MFYNFGWMLLLKWDADARSGERAVYAWFMFCVLESC